jgi:hypothetical protein
MGPFFLPMLISFIAGAFGYVLFRYSIRPVYGYTKLRGIVKREMREIEDQLNQIHTPEGESKFRHVNLEKKRLNRISTRLSSLYHNDLPSWYKIMINSRGELPIEAAQDIMTLANTRDLDHIKKKIQKIKTSLNIN